MGTSLSGLTPANTYQALIKVGDNSALSATLKRLSDGAGNDLPLWVSTEFLTNYGAGAITTNTAFGATALDSNTTGSNNTAYGLNALTANTSGTQNVGLGVDALLTNTTGIENTAVGGLALTTNNNSYNSAFGYSSQ